MRTCTESYLAAIRGTPLLSQAEVRTLFAKYHAGDESAKRSLVRHNLRLVHKVVSRYRQDSSLYMSLTQEGTLGLIRAVEKYEPDRDIRLSTYAVRWISSMIEAWLNWNKSIVHVPGQTLKLNRKVEALVEGALKSGQTISVDEMVEKTGYRRSKIVAALSVSGNSMSIDTSVAGGADDDSNLSLHNVIPCDRYSPSESEAGSSLKEWLLSEVDNLPIRHRIAVTESFGLLDGEEKSGQRVGDLMGLSRERVRQLIVESKSRLAANIPDRLADML